MTERLVFCLIKELSVATVRSLVGTAVNTYLDILAPRIFGGSSGALETPGHGDHDDIRMHRCAPTGNPGNEAVPLFCLPTAAERKR